jgi:hypothetical protein
MQGLKKYGFTHLAKKSIAIITTALSLLTGHEIKAQHQTAADPGDNSEKERLFKKNRKQQLVLKMNSNDPQDYLLAQHRSHSSHSSHRSHYSSSSGGGGGGGFGLGVLIVGGLIAAAAYSAGKNSNKK